ncbi:AbrB/MazE/SpoVT family DNA-binding domain-containing protein [Desulfobulbus sp. F5]|nr:AbrB/MazE/SpoVT family DNA-binding domain-containing protein [Desulfobulbus sp. F5]
METAKLFTNGRSQAVRLPKEFRLEGKEVFIKRAGVGILILPKNQSVWDAWEEMLIKGGEPLLAERSQSNDQQKREGLDDLFA